MRTRIIIIGGGASGLMAAVTAAENGADVTVLEQNDQPGRKLMATGNGKCNLTNLALNIENYHSSDMNRAREILDAFPPEQTIAFFHSLGLRTIDRDGWVYPETEQASQVQHLLTLRAAELHVRMKPKEHVRSVTHRKEEQSFLVTTDTWQYEADAVIVACGSPASAVRGSTADAVTIAESFGIRCRSFLPSLVPLKTGDGKSLKWAGTRIHGTVKILEEEKMLAEDKVLAEEKALSEEKVLAEEKVLPKENVLSEERALPKEKVLSKEKVLPKEKVLSKVRTFPEERVLAEDTGELQLTEYGISGIPVFQVSRAAVPALRKGKVVAELDFLPEMSDADLCRELEDRLRQFPERNLSQILIGLLPDRLIPVIAEAFFMRWKNPKDWKGKDYSALPQRELRTRLHFLADTIHHFRVNLRGAASLKQAQICTGGIDLRELGPSLECRRVPGLYFCGEAIDTDGPCGGYNLQWAWASGRAAGKGAAALS